MTNLVSNTGVVGTDVAGVGSNLSGPSGASYGGDKAIIGFGYTAPISVAVTNITNLISNTGVVSGDVSGIGTARGVCAAAGYGGDKAVFAFGYNSSIYVNITNKVSNTGVLTSDTTGIGTSRGHLAGASYGS